MSPKPQQAQLAELYVTPGQLQMRDWHQALYKFAIACALIMILGSYVSLQWATYFIGLRAMPGSLPGIGYFAVAMSLVLPVAIEGGMAIIASAFTTIPLGRRVDAISGEVRKVPKWVLLAIFSFLMALAQASNIGHAMVAVAERLQSPEAAAMPAFLPEWTIYLFAGALAALMPLGGTFMVYVAGFIREHGVGADWIDDQTEKVHIQVSPFGAAAAPAPRAPRRQTAPDAPATAPANPAPQPTATPAPAAVQEKAARPESRNGETVFAEYRTRLADGYQMQGGEIAERLGVSAGHARRVRGEWDKRIQDELAAAGGQRPDLDIEETSDRPPVRAVG